MSYLLGFDLDKLVNEVNSTKSIEVDKAFSALIRCLFENRSVGDTEISKFNLLLKRLELSEFSDNEFEEFIDDVDNGHLSEDKHKSPFG